MPYDPDLSYLIKTYSSQQFMFFFYQNTSSLLSFLFICLFWRWIMKNQHVPAAPVYIMTLISSKFALTLLDDVRSSLIWQWRLSETVLFPAPSIFMFSRPRQRRAFEPAWVKTAVASVTRSLVLWSIFMLSIACHPCSCFPHGEWHSFCL